MFRRILAAIPLVIFSGVVQADFPDTRIALCYQIKPQAEFMYEARAKDLPVPVVGDIVLLDADITGFQRYFLRETLEALYRTEPDSLVDRETYWAIFMSTCIAGIFSGYLDTPAQVPGIGAIDPTRREGV